MAEIRGVAKDEGLTEGLFGRVGLVNTLGLFYSLEAIPYLRKPLIILLRILDPLLFLL